MAGNLREYLEERKPYAKRRAKKLSAESDRRMSAPEEDMTDYDMYNSPGGERKVPWERQREMGLKNKKQPKGPAVDADTAWSRTKMGQRWRKIK